MRRFLLALWAIVALFTPANLVAQRDEEPAEIAVVTQTHYPAETIKRAPGIIVLGGAEGGMEWAGKTAKLLSESGYVAMAVAYFNSPGLEDKLQRIPLERFSAAIDILSADKRVDPDRIGILGLSKGAEAALLTASRDKRIKAVVAGSPSSVVWQGIDREGQTVESSWSLDGKSLQFIPFGRCPTCQSLGDLYEASLSAIGSQEDYAIPVERIEAPILMLSSTKDALWPSETMADAIAARLKANGFKHLVTILRYPEGGHFTLGPVASEDANADAGFGGGTPSGVVAARIKSWPQVLSFLQTALREKEPRVR